MAKFDDALLNRNSEALSKVSPLFEKLNSSWEKIECFFRSEGILQPVSLCTGELLQWHNPAESEPVGEEYIGLQKRKGKWHVCSGVSHFSAPDGIDWTPIGECSIERRIELLDHVSQLYEKLVNSNEKYVPEIEKAVARSEAVLRNLGIS